MGRRRGHTKSPGRCYLAASVAYINWILLFSLHGNSGPRNPICLPPAQLVISQTFSVSLEPIHGSHLLPWIHSWSLVEESSHSSTVVAPCAWDHRRRSSRSQDGQSPGPPQADFLCLPLLQGSLRTTKESCFGSHLGSSPEEACRNNLLLSF